MPRTAIAALLVVALCAAALVAMSKFGVSVFSANAAAWVQAIGSIAAIVSGFAIAQRQSLELRREAVREARERDNAARHEAQTLAEMAASRCAQTLLELRDPANHGGVAMQRIKRAVLADLRVVESFKLTSLKDLNLMKSFAPLAPLLESVGDEITVITDAFWSSPHGNHDALIEVKAAGIDSLKMAVDGCVGTLYAGLKASSRPFVTDPPASGGRREQ